MNAASSRSHTVFSITVRIRENAIDDNELLRTGKLNLVDLAGSENIGRSGAIEKRAREAGNINQSLLTLGRVITALVEKTPHVPYRESKLTRLLQESLGGRTKTCIIATISPSQCNMEETLSTLDYAHRAKNIQNKPEVNQKIGKVALIQEYIEEIQRLKSDLTAAREKSGIYLAQDHYNEMMLQIDSQKRELSGLLNDVKTLTDTLERKEELNKELNESLQNYFKELQETKTSLEESKVVLQHHVNTEQKLFKQAEDLLSVADIATNDVNLLHDSLGRKRRIEANNLAACSSLTNTSKNKLSGLKELVSNFQEERLNSSHEILTICDKTKEVSETGQKIENTKSECAEFFQHNIKDMVVFLEHIVHRFEKMSKEISIFRTEHQKVTEQLAVTIEEQDKKYLTFLESLNVHVNAMGVKLRDQEQILMDSKQTIIKQESEMEKVRAVFQSFFDEGSSGIKKLAKNVEKSLSSVQMTTSDVNDVTIQMDSMKTSSVASSNNVKKFLVINKTVALPVVENMESFGSEVCQEVSEQKSDFSEKQMKYLQNIHGNLDSVSEVLLNYQCDQEKEIQISEQNANNFTVTHTRLVEQTKDEQQKLIEKCENNVRCDKESVKAWSENAVQSISECDMMLEKFLSQDIMEDIPSGKTPQRRELVYPRDLAATSPHERILCRFRAAKVTETLMESDQSIESSSFQAYQEPMMDSNTSYSARTALSESSLQGRERASSASNISCENSMLPSSCKSEPSIPYALLDKENSSQQAHFGIKSRGMKRPALTEHNE
ncbi:Kinesin-like protein KLP2 [Gryllus bimaculatus]|nr:Kinesin-like protein KLP2 [Gryllus bimaculatus]